MTVIENLNLDMVREAIVDKEEFRIFERDGFVVVDYMITKADTFMHDDPQKQLILRELRGIAFSADGSKVVSRPFHKFFNIGEKEETLLANVDFSLPHTVLNKLDGSMIRTIPVDDGKAFRLGTRAGITNVSMQAENFWARPENYERYKKFFEVCEKIEVTPIFEYVGPTNRIVLHYAEENLILTAMRGKKKGSYMPYAGLVEAMNKYGIPIVQPLLDDHDMMSSDITSVVSKLQDLEGVVIAFTGGLMLKCKADDYVDKHRAVSQLKFEKDVLKLIFTNNLDDVLPILSEDVRKQVEGYRSKVVSHASEFEVRVYDKYEAIFDTFSEEIQDADDKVLRREFALAVGSNERWKRDGKFLFNLLDGKGINIPDFIVSKCGSQTGVDSIRHIIGEHKLWQLNVDDNA